MSLQEGSNLLINSESFQMESGVLAEKDRLEKIKHG